jgi:SAM-dependent methyltransferase
MLSGGDPERDFVAALKQLLEPSQRILDIGTSARFAKELRPYEHLFQGKEYIAAGYNPQSIYGPYNCDCHQDIESMSFPDASFDAVICLEVFEHVGNPFRAAAEIKRVLKPGGRLLLTTPFLAGYHGKGGASQSHADYPDLWRFTHEGLDRLFADFSARRIVPLDGPLEYRLKACYFTRWLSLKPVRFLLDRIDPRRLAKATTRHLLWGIK